MGTDSYDIPDGPEIRQRRKIREWLPEDLAEEAKVGISTVKRAERSLRMQLRNLSKIAQALDVPIEVIVPRLRGTKHSPSTGTSLQVFDHWAKSEHFLARAEKSVLIIDSYFGEYGRLGLVLKMRAKSYGPLERVEVYMASPEMDFGPQRQREAGIRPPRHSEQRNLFWNQLTDSARNSYEAHFHTLADYISSTAKPYTKRITIFEYRCMPSLRIIAIDDSHYIFGWFPLFAQNPSHTCFYLKDGDLGQSDENLLDDIRMQIESVKAASERVLKREKRLRLNRRDLIEQK